MDTASSGPVGSLVTFVNGTTADADQVNAKFSAVANAINDNDARIATIEGGLATGLVVGGPVTADRIQYSAPRTRDLSVCGSHFSPRNDSVSYTHSVGNGGAYITSGAGGLVAGVHLPHGAVITYTILEADQGVPRGPNQDHPRHGRGRLAPGTTGSQS